MEENKEKDWAARGVRILEALEAERDALLIKQSEAQARYVELDNLSESPARTVRDLIELGMVIEDLRRIEYDLKKIDYWLGIGEKNA